MLIGGWQNRNLYLDRAALLRDLNCGAQQRRVLP
jgi:hypothetical protein